MDNEKELLTCKMCDKTFKAFTGLGNHIRHFHVKKCEIESLQAYYDKYILVDISEKQCEYCNAPVDFIGIKRGYKRHCSLKCANANPKVRHLKYEQSKKAMLEKYGVKNIFSHKTLKQQAIDKMRQTKLERYGKENYVNVKKQQQTTLKRYGKKSFSQTEEYKVKINEISLNRYGVDHYTQSDTVKQKTKETNLERYGKEYTLQVKEIRDKGTQTMIEKYGAPTTLESKELKEKYDNTMLEKYGTIHPQQNQLIKGKTEQTNIERYGSKSTLQNKQILQEKYEVDNTNKLGWVIEKQKANRLKNNLEKYGVENVSQLDWVQDTIKENNLEKYGFTNPMQNEEIKQRLRDSVFKKYGVENAMQNEKIFNKQQASLSKKTYRLIKYTTKFGTNIHYQSKAELRFIIYCDDNNIHIEDGDVIEYTHNDKMHKYFIDFKIKENEKWRLIEIKKKHMWWFQGLENGTINAKILSAIQYSKNNSYLPYKIKFNY